jgi:hypothetical protein
MSPLPDEEPEISPNKPIACLAEFVVFTRNQTVARE